MIGIMQSIEGFDEKTYLNENPDVRKAVENSDGYTGWRHFWDHGFREDRLGVPLEVYKAVQNLRGYDYTSAVPPTHLRRRVHGANDLPSFDNVGRVLSSNVFDEMIRLSNFSGEGQILDGRILDFGCGCGRVTRHLHELCVNNHVNLNSWFGSDIDTEAIRWCQRFLHPIATFVVNENNPPLPFEDEFFDFVYSISIFTHLPEDMQFNWLAELQRVTRRNGFLLLTTHGEDLCPLNDKSRFLEAGFQYNVGQGTKGLPDFYQVAYHTHDYIRNRWSKYFAVRKIIKRGIANRQDLVLCERIM